MKEKLYLVTEVGSFDATLLADRVSDSRGTKEYSTAKDELIDCTMSGTPEEAIKWMLMSMREAIVQGFRLKAEDVLGNREQVFSNRCKFLAAYDLYIELSK